MASEAEIKIAPDDDSAATVVDGGAGLTPDMPLIASAGPRESAFWLRCLATAVMLHAVVLGALNWPVSEDLLGGGGTDLEAISVEMVQASALQSTVDTTATTDAARATQLDEREGSDRQQETAVEAADRKQEQKPETTAKAQSADLVIPDAVASPDPPNPDAPQITIAARPAEAEPAPREATTEPTAKQRPDQAATSSSRQTEAQVESAAGGALSRSQSTSGLSVVTAAAARLGRQRVYGSAVFKVMATSARSVPQRLVARESSDGKSRAGRTKRRGTVGIRFAVMSDGTLAYVRVDTPSGDPILDDEVVRMMREARFPAPPTSLTFEHRLFKSSIKFE